MFAVPRKGFVRDSEFFRELFELPPEKGKPADGSTRDYPLHIEGVKKEEMALLLRAMYPAYVHFSETIVTIFNRKHHNPDICSRTTSSRPKIFCRS